MASSRVKIAVLRIEGGIGILEIAVGRVFHWSWVKTLQNGLLGFLCCWLYTLYDKVFYFPAILLC